MPEELRVTEERILIRSARDMDEADMIFKRTFKARDVATRRDWPPVGFIARLRWELARATERRLT